MPTKLEVFRDGLVKDKLECFKALKAHIASWLRGTMVSEQARELMLVEGVLAYDAIHALITEQAKQLKAGEVLQLVDVACGYGFLLPLIDLICQKAKINYQMLFIDIDRKEDEFGYSQFFSHCYADKRFSHIRFIKTDAADAQGCIKAIKAAGLWPAKGFDLGLYLHPKLDSDPGSPPIKIFTDTMPLLASRVFTAHYTPLEGAALLSHACANEEFRRSCPYPAFSGFVHAANQSAQPERFAAGPLQLGPFLTAQPFLASAKKLVAEAPYPLVKLVDPRGGAHAVNAGMHTPLTYQFVFNVQLKPEKLYQLGRYEEALSRFQATKAKQFDGLKPVKQWVLLMNIGRCQLKLKQFSEAKKSFTTAASHPIAAANEDKKKLAQANFQEAGAWLALEHDDPENQARDLFDRAVAAYQSLGKATTYYQEMAEYLSQPSGSIVGGATSFHVASEDAAPPPGAVAGAADLASVPGAMP